MEFVFVFIVVLGLVLWAKSKIGGQQSGVDDTPSYEYLNVMDRIHQVREELEEIEHHDPYFWNMGLDTPEFYHPDRTSSDKPYPITVELTTADCYLTNDEPPPPIHVQKAILELGEKTLEQWKTKLKQGETDRRLSTEETTRQYLDVLCRKYRQSVYMDEYDSVELSNFENEVQYFLSKKLPDVHFEDAYSIILEMVQEAVSLDDSDEGLKFDPDMSPQEFETYCGELLKNEGWDVREVGGSGDQGCDLVVSKSGTKGVIQCKLYSSPVGNKAVQEVYSGKEWEDADFAAVVTNNSYTKNAKKLAAKNAVHLLHYEDLPRLSAINGVDDETFEINDDDNQQIAKQADDVVGQWKAFREGSSSVIEESADFIESREQAITGEDEDSNDLRDALIEQRELNESYVELFERTDTQIREFSIMEPREVSKNLRDITDHIAELNEISNEISVSTENVDAVFSNLDDVTKAHLILNGYPIETISQGLPEEIQEKIDADDGYADLAAASMIALSNNRRGDDDDDVEVLRVATANGISM